MSSTLSRTTAHPHFDHLAVVHDGPERLAALLRPYLTSAIAAGEPVLVCTDSHAWEALRDTLGPAAAGVEYLPDDVRYSTPARAMKIVHDFVQRALQDGAPAVWSVGAVPFGGHRDPDWLRYEAAVNDVLAHLPLKAMCTYDVSDCPPALLDTAADTHASLIDDAGRHDSDRFALAGWPGSPIVVPDRPPDVWGTPETPAEARLTARRLLSAHGPESLGGDLEVVVSELVTNAHEYGDAPVELAIWRESDGSRFVIAVTDHGSGITDPFFELRPPPNAPGGAGLWIVGQLADHVGTDRVPGGAHRVVATISLG